MTVLLSSHLLDQVQSVCDRVGIFAHGKLIGVGTVAELATKFGDGAAHVEVTFADGAEDPAATLRRVAGVDGAELDPDSGAWQVVIRPALESARVREEIVGAAAAANLRMTSLRELEPSLEDIYRSAVAGMGRGFAIEEEPS